MLRQICTFILHIAGWKAAGKFPYELKKYIVIVGPHTSNWDFVIGVLFRKALRLEKARYLGKKELFDPPFGFLFRWLGGYPVDRSKNKNMVEEVVKVFNQREEFGIALSPEGTRKRVDKLRTGFYNIAKGANVPIVIVGLDYENKRVFFSKPFTPTDNQEADFEYILKFFRPIKGKFPEKGLGHL